MKPEIIFAILKVVRCLSGVRGRGRLLKLLNERARDSEKRVENPLDWNCDMENNVEMWSHLAKSKTSPTPDANAAGGSSDSPIPKQTKGDLCDGAFLPRKINL